MRDPPVPEAELFADDAALLGGIDAVTLRLRIVGLLSWLDFDFSRPLFSPPLAVVGSDADAVGGCLTPARSLAWDNAIAAVLAGGVGRLSDGRSCPWALLVSLDLDGLTNLPPSVIGSSAVPDPPPPLPPDDMDLLLVGGVNLGFFDGTPVRDARLLPLPPPLTLCNLDGPPDGGGGGFHLPPSLFDGAEEFAPEDGFA